MSVKQPESAELKSEKTKDIRSTNIIAARGTLSLNSLARIANPIIFVAVSDVVRTSLGPRGMDKIVSLIVLIWNVLGQSDR